jgi:PTS system mannose-specific IIB component
MREIVLTRIDDRLIHGQVVTAWVKQTKGNRIIIVDEELAKDDFMRKILKAAAPSGISVEVNSAEDAVALLKSEAAAGEKIILLVKTPQPLETLMEAGVDLKTVVLGGMGLKSGRKKLYRNIAASDEEVTSMKQLIGKGVAILAQMTPDERPVDVSKLNRFM